MIKVNVISNLCISTWRIRKIRFHMYTIHINVPAIGLLIIEIHINSELLFGVKNEEHNEKPMKSNSITNFLAHIENDERRWDICSLFRLSILFFSPKDFRWTLRRHVSKWFWPFSVWCCDWATHFDHWPPMPFVLAISSSWSSLPGGVASQPLERSVHVFECNSFAVFAIACFGCRSRCSAANWDERKECFPQIHHEI